MTGKTCHFRSEEHTSELQSHHDLVCRLLLEKKKKIDELHAVGKNFLLVGRGWFDSIDVAYRRVGIDAHLPVARLRDQIERQAHRFFILLRLPPSFALCPYPTLFR